MIAELLPSVRPWLWPWESSEPLRIPGAEWQPGPECGQSAPLEDYRGRAVIGDELRQPMVWCQLDNCIERYTARAALGEIDIRLRALAAGWRHDAFDRLICPSCLQRYPVWSALPIARWVPPPTVPVPESSAAQPDDRDGVAEDEPEDRVDAAIERAWRSHPGRHRRDFFTDD